MKICIDLFLTGLALGWGPCLSFCAPILVPYIAGTQKNWLAGLKISLTFSLARIIPYVVLSLISAKLGQYLVRRFYQTQAGSIIYSAAAVFVLLLGVIVVLGKSGHLPFCGAFKRLNLQGGIGEMILFGIVVGFAPCLPLFGVLTYIAFNAQNLLHGAILGLVFGIGTLISPLILLGPAAGGIAQFLQYRPLVYKILSRACGAILIYIAVGMLIR